jgi:hypothetical protein
MHIRIAMFVMTLAITAAGSVFADQVYKWTDDEGNVYYSDTPVANAQRVAIDSRPTDPKQAPGETRTRADAQAQEAEDAVSAPQEPTQEELQAEARERAENCTKYKERQLQFAQSRRIYRMDEDGERVYYDEEEMAATRARVAEQVNEYCN